jgi:hypothetical protein
MIAWHTIPFDEGVPRGAPSCQDGEEILVRIDGEAVPITCDRRHGVTALVGEDGEDVDWSRVDAIAHRPRPRPAPVRSRTDQFATKLLPGYVARLRAICDSEGATVAELIESWVEMEEREILSATEIVRGKRTAT